MSLCNKPTRGAACPIAAPMRLQPSPAGQPCTSSGALRQLGGITPSPNWCNTPLSGVTPLRNKRDCGRLIVRSGLCGHVGVYVVVPSEGLCQTADPFTIIPRNPAVFAQWVCTLVDRHVHRHCCSAISLHWMGGCCSSGRSWAGEMVGSGVPASVLKLPVARLRDRACC